MAEGGTQRQIFFPALDTLRAVFCFSVILFHLAGRLPATRDGFMTSVYGVGGLGVPFFFVLSAFLITHLLLEEKERTGLVSVKDFYIRRALRIWPLYYLVSMGCIYVVEPMLGRPGQEHYAVPFGFFFANDIIGKGPIPPFSFAIFWSVCVEEQFYVVWPWFIKFLNARGLLIAAISLIVSAPVIRYFRYEAGIDTHVEQWFFTLSHLDCFGAGVLASLAHRGGFALKLKRHLGLIAISVVLGLTGLQAIGGTLIAEGRVSSISVWTETLVPLCAALLIFAGAQPASGLSILWRSRIGLYLGSISYGIYAYHAFVISVFSPTISAPEAVKKSLIVLVLPVAIASVSYFLFERPILRLKHRFQRVESGQSGHII